MRGSIISVVVLASLIVTWGCRTQPSVDAKGVDHSARAANHWTARTKEAQGALTPQDALAMLRAGNERFVAGRAEVRDLREEVHATASHQYPYAIILSCIDSRQPAELIFDQGIGDVFSARIAGNVLDDDVLGSMEFACAASGSKLIVVLGHSNCGAVKGAIDNVDLGHLNGLLDRIKPAIAAVPQDAGSRDSKNGEFVQKVADANVELVMKQIRQRSPILRDMIDQHRIGLVGGMYDLNSGQVHFNSK
jgi:carbonic anhydrase